MALRAVETSLEATVLWRLFDSIYTGNLDRVKALIYAYSVSDDLVEPKTVRMLPLAYMVESDTPVFLRPGGRLSSRPRGGTAFGKVFRPVT